MRHTILHFFLFGLFIGVLPEPGRCEEIAGRPEAFLDAPAIYNTWEANLGRIEDVQYKCTQVLQDFKGKDPGNLTAFSYVERIQEGPHFFIYYHGLARESAPKDSIRINAFDGYVGKEYDVHRQSGDIYRGVRDRPVEAEDPVGIYMGTAVWHWDTFRGKPISAFLQWASRLKEDFPGGAPILTFDYTRGLKDGFIWVRPYLESVSGQMCHVMAVVFSGGEGYLFWFAHEKGMLLMRKETYRAGEELGERIEVQQIAHVMTPLGEVWYPRVATRELRYDDYSLTYTLHVHEYIPGVVVPSETFDFAFPDGTKVLDEVTGMQYQQDGPYKKDVLCLFGD